MGEEILLSRIGRTSGCGLFPRPNGGIGPGPLGGGGPFSPFGGAGGRMFPAGPP